MKNGVMNFYVFILILLSTCKWSHQQDDMVGAAKARNFKGLPKLPDIDVMAGERRYVLYHEQTMAIIDVTSRHELLHCEVIEVYEPEEFSEVAQNLSRNYVINEVNFDDMLGYMEKCDALDNIPTKESSSPTSLMSIFRHNISPFFSGIISGTKWCGMGDIAKNYHDLGSIRNFDRCCRAHDLCPVKVRAHTNRFNIKNNDSYISKSHCTCEEIFYDCLKSIKNEVTNRVGQIYFNVVRPPCIEDDEQLYTKENFRKLVPTKMQF